MIDPRSQRIIYEEQQAGQMLQIERKLKARERGGYAQAAQPLLSAAGQWLKGKVFSRGSAEPEMLRDSAD